MRKEQKDIDGLGPIGIIREAFRLFSKHFKFSMLIQLTLLIPLAILAVTTECWVSRNSQNNPSSLGASRAPHLPGNSVLFLNGASGLEAALKILAVVIFLALFGIVIGAVKALSASAVLYAVGLNYTGQSISFGDVLRVSVPRLWMRLTVTKIYKIVLAYSMILVQSEGSILLIRQHAVLGGPLMLIGVTVLAALDMAVVGYLQMVFMVADSVSVLEKHFGWAAVRRTLKLLKGRLTVAILFQLLWLVPTIVALALQRAFRYVSINGDFSAWSATALMLGAVIYIWWMSFLWFMTALCSGVQYVSFKTYHNEDLEECIYKQQTMKAGYERVAGESDDAKVGKQVEDLV